MHITIIKNLETGIEKNCDILKKNNNILEVVIEKTTIKIFLKKHNNIYIGKYKDDLPHGEGIQIFPNGDNIARHPSQIYEAILEGLVLFVVINFLALKKNLLLKTGYISGLFLILYSILRIFSESFREPDKHLGYFFDYFSMGTILSFATCIAGFFIIFFIKKNEQNN